MATPPYQPADEHAKPLPEMVRQQLAEILASGVFARARRQSAFLAYLIEKTLEGRQEEISEYSIAQLYDRPASFDPSTDPIVRVEARRLRLRLESYYAGEGRGAAVLFNIPSGTYIPEMVLRPAEEGTRHEAESPAMPEAASPVPSAAPSPRKVWKTAALVTAVLFTLALGIWALVLWVGTARRPQTGIRETTELTSYPGQQLQPTLSPDHQRMAFSWDGDNGENFDIYVKSIGGREISRLTNNPARDQSPAWSPDGQTIAFLRALPDLRQAVYVISANGGGERLVTTITTFVAGICWTPDSRYLVVPDSGPSIPLGLFRVSVLTGERLQLTEYKGDFFPSVSPDGRTLAFVRSETDRPGSGLCLQRLTGDFLPEGAPEVLDSTGGNRAREGGDSHAGRENVSWPSWSTDGRTILFTWNTKEGPVAARMHVEGRRFETIGELRASTDVVLEYSSKQYIYSRLRAHRFLAWARPGSGAPVPEFRMSQDDSEPDLSADGSKLVFVSSRTGVAALHLADVNGRNVRRLDIPGVLPASPRWSPDSMHIVFTGWTGSQPKVYLTGLTGGRPELVQTGKGDAYSAVFSRDGKWIYYCSNQNGFLQIWRIAASGGVPELMTQDPGFFPEESVDGSKLYYGWRGNIRQLDLQTRQSTPVLDNVCEFAVRATASGLYAAERGPTETCSQIRFHPFSSGAPSSPLKAGGAISGFSVNPRNADLLVGFNQETAHIEAVTLPR